MLKSALLFLLNLSTIKCQNGKFEGFIVQGQNADIRSFSYSTFLYVSDPFTGDWICGGSILNQDLVLTAAHCLYGARAHQVLVKYGHANRHMGFLAKSFNLVIHHLYTDTDIEWDIGMIKLTNPVVFGVNVGRVAIMQYPPYGMAKVAGWGSLHDSIEDNGSHELQHTQQWVSNHSVCERMIGYVPRGTICGGFYNEQSYPSRGDSGSALVVNNYIQVGIVSFKRTDVSRSIVVYSDVGYYFNWITRNAYQMCVLKNEADAKNRAKTTKKPRKKIKPTHAPVFTSRIEDDFFYQIFPYYG